MISKFNLLAPWSGYGAIQGVLNKSSDAPMVYRVLVPWLLGRKFTLWKYNLFQIVAIWGVLVSVYIAWGIQILLITMVLMTITFWFDYWDWSIELIGFTLALVSFPVALLGITLLALSRETAPLVGLVYFLHSNDLLGGLLITLVGLLTLLLVRKVQGKHKLYCKRWMILDNIELLKKGNISAWISVFVILVGMSSIPSMLQLHRLDVLIVPVIVVAGLLLAKVNETRVFVTVIPYVALWISKLF